MSEQKTRLQEVAMALKALTFSEMNELASEIGSALRSNEADNKVNPLDAEPIAFALDGWADEQLP